MSEVTINEISGAVLHLATCIGHIISVMHSHKVILARAIITAMTAIEQISDLMSLSLPYIINRKMDINMLKYDLTSCINHTHSPLRDIPKYTDFAHTTGNKKDSIPMFVSDTDTYASKPSSYDIRVAFKPLSKKIEKFAMDRGWNDKYTPTTTMIAAVSEVGELAKVIEWKKTGIIVADHKPLVDELSRELADVAIYLFHLCRIAEISDPFEA